MQRAPRNMAPYRGDSSAAEQDPQQVHADQSRALTDVAAPTGDHRVAGKRGPVGEAHVKTDVANRLPSLPPSGPAIPVIETATSASKRFSAPIAIASATCGETAPWVSIRLGSTPSNSVFAWLE